MHACMHACIHITQNRQDDIWVCMNMVHRLKQQFSLRKLRYAVTFGLQYFQTIHFCSAHYIVQLTSSISTCWTHSTLWMGSVCVCVCVCVCLSTSWFGEPRVPFFFSYGHIHIWPIFRSCSCPKRNTKFHSGDQSCSFLMKVFSSNCSDLTMRWVLWHI